MGRSAASAEPPSAAPAQDFARKLEEALPREVLLEDQHEEEDHGNATIELLSKGNEAEQVAGSARFLARLYQAASFMGTSSCTAALDTREPTPVAALLTTKHLDRFAAPAYNNTAARRLGSKHPKRLICKRQGQQNN
eukprot:CAMPEP_0181439842 /NCGR_PEP_ID=MMETSP1110-20121109/22644_1 /TAXON_ID=174948 /ORGANISM="Symbiodinium sp., Strain CCMP421" /LENGTH=136 /DNA_ID=CAMNT_0023563595 /DNA_START=81 /DNA_END=492 /DNA_ORIENTATION=-